MVFDATTCHGGTKNRRDLHATNSHQPAGDLHLETKGTFDAL